jgi:hypothetical protein
MKDKIKTTGKRINDPKIGNLRNNFLAAIVLAFQPDIRVKMQETLKPEPA